MLFEQEIIASEKDNDRPSNSSLISDPQPTAENPLNLKKLSAPSILADKTALLTIISGYNAGQIELPKGSSKSINSNNFWLSKDTNFSLEPARTKFFPPLAISFQSFYFLQTPTSGERKRSMFGENVIGLSLPSYVLPQNKIIGYLRDIRAIYRFNIKRDPTVPKVVGVSDESYGISLMNLPKLVGESDDFSKRKILKWGYFNALWGNAGSYQKSLSGIRFPWLAGMKGTRFAYSEIRAQMIHSQSPDRSQWGQMGAFLPYIPLYQSPRSSLQLAPYFGFFVNYFKPGNSVPGANRQWTWTALVGLQWVEPWTFKKFGLLKRK